MSNVLTLFKAEDGTPFVNQLSLGQLAGIAKDLAAAAIYGEFVGSVSGTVLTVTTVNAGALAVGGVVFSSTFAQATITSFGTGTGGTGTYNLSATLSGTLFTNGAWPQEQANITNNGAGIWNNGEKISVFGQPGTRNWFVGASAALSHARNVMLPGGRTATLTANSNVVLATTGAPASGTGNNGDIAVDVLNGLYYGPKVSGAWGSALQLAGVPAGTTANTYTVGNDARIGVPTSAGLDTTFGTTQGSIIYRGASGWVALTPGTSGQVLQSGGAGANPSWVAAASGGGVASTSTTATPVLQLGGTNATATYTVQTLRYVQIGPVVEFTLDIEWSALTSGSGVVTITGLPAGATLSSKIGVQGFGVTPSTTPYAVVSGGGSIAIMLSGSGAPTTDVGMPGTALGSAGGLLISGRYFVA